MQRYSVTIGQHVQTVRAVSFQGAVDQVRQDLAEVTAVVVDANGTLIEVPPRAAPAVT